MRTGDDHPPVEVAGVDGSAPAIRSTADVVRARQGDLDTAAAHVRAATAVLDGNHGKHVARLRESIDPLASRYKALGDAYDDVATILDDYADGVADLQSDAQRLQSQVADDEYRLWAARQQCLASDPAFPGADTLPWDYAPSSYAAPNMDGLGRWHNAINDLACSRDTLTGVADRRRILDENTAARLRDVTVHGPGVTDWMHELASVGALGAAGTKGTLKGLKVKNLLKYSKEYQGALSRLREAEGVTDDLKADVVAAKTALAAEATSTGVPGAWALGKLGLAENAAVLRVLTPVGKVLGPVGAGFSLVNAYEAFAHPEHDGARKLGDRLVAGAGAIGGGTQLLMLAGVMSTTGVGVPIVLGAAVVVGAWALGTAIYDHWDDITGFASKAWKGYVDLDRKLADVETAVARKAVHAVEHPVQAAQKAGHFIKGLFS